MASRKDSKGRKLNTGESQRTDGIYAYRYINAQTGNREAVYSKDLKELRRKEKEVNADIDDHILTGPSVKDVTLNSLWEVYLYTKVLDDGTKANYISLWNAHIRDTIGQLRITDVRTSTIKMLYAKMDKEKYACSTLQSIHNLLNPLLELAVNDDYIRKNPARSITIGDYGKKTKFKTAISPIQQKQLLEFMQQSKMFSKHIPMMTIMLETSLRCGELIGLTYNDVDLKKKELYVTHQLTYRNYQDGEGCKFRIKKTKTDAGKRTIPLTDAACDAFRTIKLQNFQLGKICSVTIDGYTDFIFVTKHGRPMMPNGVNNALYNVVKYYNEYELKKASKEKREPVLIHQFSSHVMRHTGCTNMARSGVNIKAAQYIMGHAKSDVTLDVYNHLNNAFDAKLEIKKLEKNGTVMVQ